jgi:hypothetical protein
VQEEAFHGANGSSMPHQAGAGAEFAQRMPAKSGGALCRVAWQTRTSPSGAAEDTYHLESVGNAGQII